MKDVICEMGVSANSAYRRQHDGQAYHIRFLSPAIANHSGCGGELQSVSVISNALRLRNMKL
ncbi:MAG TPA: hypothetical protein VHO84_07605 [Syntrophorhabdaceae bacterium]|nr:hypothetical protein [Syntrophorhabdaceae bacterium]